MTAISIHITLLAQHDLTHIVYCAKTMLQNISTLAAPLNDELYMHKVSVRTILTLGIGHICWYWAVLVLGDNFIGCDANTNTNQTAVGAVHRITISRSAVR